MSVVRVNKNKDYTVMSNYHFKDKNMSLKAKGLLSLMLSLPEKWDYSIEGLIKLNKDNETSVKSALKELKVLNYLKVSKLTPDKTESGRIEYIYDIYEEPYEKQEGKKQEVEFLPLEFLQVENQGQLNTNILNTNNKNISNEFDIYIINNFKQNLQCECISKTTKERCLRRSSYNINGINYCNQHSRGLIPDLLVEKQNHNLEKEIKYFNNLELNNLFIEFLEVRKKIKAVNSERAIKALINKLNKYEDSIKIQMIEKSIINSWKDVFEIPGTKPIESTAKKLPVFNDIDNDE